MVNTVILLINLLDRTGFRRSRFMPHNVRQSRTFVTIVLLIAVSFVLWLFVKCLLANYSYSSILIGLVIINGTLNQCYLIYINLFSSISYIVNECFCLTYVIYYVSVFNQYYFLDVLNIFKHVYKPYTIFSLRFMSTWLQKLMLT